MKNRKIVFLTLAKGQSLRLKNKNIISFKGKPLIHWVIKKILRISKNYYVNSDSNFILDYSKKIGAKTIKRNKDLLDNSMPSRVLMMDSFSSFPKDTYAVIHVQANSPNLEIEKLKKVYNILKYTDIEDIFSINSNGEINGSFWGITKKKLKTYNMNIKIHDHKALKTECWFVDDSIDIHYRQELKKAEKIFSKKKLY